MSPGLVALVDAEPGCGQRGGAGAEHDQREAPSESAEKPLVKLGIHRDHDAEVTRLRQRPSFDADERTYGDGDARWPNPSKSTLAHVQNHATMFVLFGTTFALWGGLFTAVLVFPIGGAAGLAFGVGRVRPVAIELARRGVTL